MKKALYIVIVLFVLVSQAFAGVTNEITFPSDQFESRMKQFRAQAIQEGAVFVTSEGEWGPQKSYFCLLGGPQGGRVVYAGKVSPSGDFLGTSPEFVDSRTGGTCVPTLTAGEFTSAPDGFLKKYFSGSIKFESDTYPILIAFKGNLGSPQFMFTWGDGSGPGDVGKFTDDFNTLKSVENRPAPPYLDIVNLLKDQVDKDDPSIIVPKGMYVLVTTPLNFKVQVARDLKIKSWSDIQLELYGDFDDFVVYKVTPSSSYSNFRAVEL